MKMKKRMIALKDLSLNMKMVVNCLNFIFHSEVTTKSKYKILNFFFHFIKTRNGTLSTRIKNVK